MESALSRPHLQAPMKGCILLRRVPFTLRGCTVPQMHSQSHNRSYPAQEYTLSLEPGPSHLVVCAVPHKHGQEQQQRGCGRARLGQVLEARVCEQRVRGGTSHPLDLGIPGCHAGLEAGG